MFNNLDIAFECEKGLVEDMIVYSSGTNPKQILVPDNRAELIIPFVETLSVKPIGYSRNIQLSIHSSYFFTPRGRGLEIRSKNDAMDYVIFKINPVYTKHIVNDLDKLAAGIYQMNFDDAFLQDIIRAYSSRNFFKLNRMMECFFQTILIDCKEEFVSDTLIDSIDQIKYASGSITVKEIYSSLSVSKSKLEQHFNRAIGLTPKEFCKIEKINYFIKSYYKNEGKSLTELTYECGYYDQSHLIKDFRYFMDVSPKQYFDSLSIHSIRH